MHLNKTQIVPCVCDFEKNHPTAKIGHCAQLRFAVGILHSSITCVMDKYLVYCRILPPGSKNPFNLKIHPENSDQTGSVDRRDPWSSYPVKLGEEWQYWLCGNECQHCRHNPCCAGEMLREWCQMITMRSKDRLLSNEQYMNSWLQEQYRNFVTSNTLLNNSSDDGIKYRCLCIEEELGVFFPQRCQSCGFKSCLVYQVGKMIYEYLRKERRTKSDVVKFREMIALFKGQWLLRHSLRDSMYNQDLVKRYRPGWMRDDLFSNGHAPDCVETYGRLLFPRVAYCWDPDELHPPDDPAQRITEDDDVLFAPEERAFHRWVEWCEDPDDHSLFSSSDDESYFHVPSKYLKVKSPPAKKGNTKDEEQEGEGLVHICREGETVAVLDIGRFGYAFLDREADGSLTDEE